MTATHICPDCGAEIPMPFHVCLDQNVAAHYLYELRTMNALKNDQIERLESIVAKAKFV